jgi:hypothetical protein
MCGERNEGQRARLRAMRGFLPFGRAGTVEKSTNPFDIAAATP